MIYHDTNRGHIKNIVSMTSSFGLYDAVKVETLENNSNQWKLLK